MVAEAAEDQGQKEIRSKEVISSNLSNGCSNHTGSEIYLHISSKGILSYYRDQEGETQYPSSLKSDAFADEATDPRNIPVKLTMVDAADGSFSLTPSAAKTVDDLGLRAIYQTAFSIMRNVGCYAFFGSALYLAIAGQMFFHELHFGVLDERIAVLVCFVAGAVAVPFQLIHILSEWKIGKTGTTIIASMLRNPFTQTKFKELVSHLRDAAPYLGAEIRLRKELFCTKLPHNETARKLDTVFDFDSWADASLPLSDARWRSDDSGWLIVGKDYRLSGVVTEAWLREETEKFKHSVDFYKNRWRMSLDYVLDLREGMTFPDAQAFLVHPSDCATSRFYSLQLYKVLLFLCLDCLYNIIFHVRTRKYANHSIVKVIKRYDSQ